MDKIFFDTVILVGGHSLIMPHKPESIQMSQVNTKLEDAPQDIHQFGLFDRATPNYTTYYPDVTQEDLNPEDSEFIEPIFRMLSNVTVHAQFNPIYFPADVLKKSMYKLIGQTINIDHEMAVGNAIGSIKSVEWQNSYTANGVKIPSGINAVLKIDGKSNPRIARGIMMDPPSIHANSVTVNFAWKKSHPKMDDQEFFGKLGSFDDKGKLVQRIATEIRAYHETSLVSHGADPFAQKIGDNGKIVNPSYAGSRYPLSGDPEKDTESNHLVWDWKDLTKSDGEDIVINTSTGTTIPEDNNNINNEQNSENMEALLRFLETFFGLEAESLTEENYQETLGEIDFAALKAAAEKKPEPVTVLDLEGVEAIENEITTLRTFKEGVPEDLAEQIVLAETGKAAIEELRAETKRLYGLTVEEGKEDATILALIAGADYKTLQSLHKQYDKTTEGEFNFTCTDCGSHNVTRASATPGAGGDEHVTKSSQEVIDSFTSVDQVKIPKTLRKPEDK